MIKVFESFDISRAGQLQSLLESHGIRTYLKNQYSAGVMGELPFIEVCPQLYILEDQDLGRAQALLVAESPVSDASDWSCAVCGAEHTGAFTECWQCGARR